MLAITSLGFTSQEMRMGRGEKSNGLSVMTRVTRTK